MEAPCGSWTATQRSLHPISLDSGTYGKRISPEHGPVYKHLHSIFANLHIVHDTMLLMIMFIPKAVVNHGKSERALVVGSDRLQDIIARLRELSPKLQANFILNDLSELHRLD